jgi:site-specific DNA recombinase
MSDDKQENSIDRQRSQVEPLAARGGYEIVTVYTDEGIAGDEEEKRKGFTRMIQDAAAGRFSVILCDDKDRLGRFDSITQGYYVHQLRRAGVRVVTVAQGALDWDSFAGRITDAVLQEAKKLESLATSRRVATRMLMMAKAGQFLGGKPPFGFTLADHPAGGKRLAPGKPVDVATVRRIFDLYGNHRGTLDAIATELHNRNVRNPRGGPFWDKTTIRALLRNRKYVGDLTWNVGHDGKYSSVVNGHVEVSDAKTPKRRNRPDDWVVVAAAHEPLIERPLFNRVQRRLASNRRYTTPNAKKDFALTGLLVCGNCGWRLTGTTQNGVRYYRCGRYHHSGKAACSSNTIKEEKVVAVLIAKLQEFVFNPEVLAELKAETRRQEEQTRRVADGRAPELRRRIAELDRMIAKGIENVALAPRDIVADLSAQVRDWKTERSALTGELDRPTEPDDGTDIDDAVRRVEALAGRLQESLANAEPGELRALFEEMVERIELFFLRKPKQRKESAVFQRGVIHLRQHDDESTQSLNGARRGCRSSLRV